MAVILSSADGKVITGVQQRVLNRVACGLFGIANCDNKLEVIVKPGTTDTLQVKPGYAIVGGALVQNTDLWEFKLVDRTLANITLRVDGLLNTAQILAINVQDNTYGNLIEQPDSKAHLKLATFSFATGAIIGLKNINIYSEAMQKAAYDTNSNGVVDNAEKLGGQLPAYYATKASVDSVSTIANNAVPKTRTINAKALTGNISLTPADVGALPSSGSAVDALKLGGQLPAYYATKSSVDSVSAVANNAVPKTTTINSRALTGNISLNSADVGASTTATYSANINTSWAGGAAPYTQTVAISGILASDNPIVDAVLSTNAATAKAQLEAWGSVDKIVTAANSITVTCFTDKPKVIIPIQLKVVR